MDNTVVGETTDTNTDELSQISMQKSETSLESIIEALLFASEKPMTLEKLISAFPNNERPQISEVKHALNKIAEHYKARGIELHEVASGYRFQVGKHMMRWVSSLWEEKPARYTRAMLETLALIAYRQPITRGEIEDVRGVSVSSNIVRTLQEREWIRIVGRRNVPGRPAMYATTRQFLDYFNLKNLNELPTLGEVKSLESMAERLETGLQEELKGVESAIHKDKVTKGFEQENKVNHDASPDNKPETSDKSLLLVNHETARIFKEETERVDKEVFATVDELLSNVKTDFTDYSENQEDQVTQNQVEAVFTETPQGAKAENT